jgi:hypothetical protein
MPSVEDPRGTERGRVSNARTVSSGAGVHPSSRAGRANRLRPKLRGLFAGLNELLKLSDFSRGDVFRD